MPTRSNATNGLSSFGIPVLDFALMRAAAYGANVFFVDPRRSSGGNGKTPYNAFTTITAAYNACTDEAGDVIVYLGTDGTTGSSSRDTASLTWSKSGITLVGACAPVHVSQRCRIAPSTTFAGALLNVTGHNNVFANIALFQGHDAASTCLTVAGERNYFWNVHIAGIGHATAGDDAASESLFLNAGSENLFEKCTIGIDTIARSAACAEIRCDAAATRNKFVDCEIRSFADNAGALFVDIPGSGDIDRDITFERCQFRNPIDSTATVMTVAMTIHASAGGTVVLKDCLRYGATDWAADFTNLAQLSLNSGTAATDMGAAINGS